MALDLTSDPSERARLLLELGRAIVVTGAHVRAASTFEAGLAELERPDSDLARELQAARWMCATLDGTQADELLAAGDLEVGDDSQTPTPGQRQMLAQLAVQRALENRPPSEVAALAERAWGDGALLSAESSDGMTWSLVTGALYFVGELERDIEICDMVIADARARGSPMAYATACYCRGCRCCIAARLTTRSRTCRAPCAHARMAGPHSSGSPSRRWPLPISSRARSVKPTGRWSWSQATRRSSAPARARSS